MSLAIITVTLNNLTALQRTLASVAAQSAAPDEHWIVDGGSTDGTREFLASLPPCPGRRVLSEKDAGIYDAMNKGVALATSGFVWFLNAGDTCADPAVISDINRALRDHPDIDGLYGKVWRKNVHGLRSVGGPVRARDFGLEMPVCHQALVYRRSRLVAETYPTSYRFISDWIVTKRLFEAGACFRYLDRHLCVYDLSGVSSRSRFAIIREKLNYTRGPGRRIHILAGCGARACALWLAEKTGVHGLLKKKQHSRPRADSPGG